MSMLEDKITYIQNILAEWKLSAKEESQLFPQDPTEEDCDNLYELKVNLSSIRLLKDNSELPEKDHIQFQPDWLRASIPALGGKTPLAYVEGDRTRLVELVLKIQGPQL